MRALFFSNANFIPRYHRLCEASSSFLKLPNERPWSVDWKYLSRERRPALYHFLLFPGFYSTMAILRGVYSCAVVVPSNRAGILFKLFRGGGVASCNVVYRIRIIDCVVSLLYCSSAVCLCVLVARQFSSAALVQCSLNELRVAIGSRLKGTSLIPADFAVI